MLERIKRAQSIHLVGISGTEGSAIMLFLLKLGVDFTAHDFSPEAKFKRSFKANHLGYSPSAKEKILGKIIANRSRINFQDNYLKDIGKADLIFVSQNWEAYSPNRKLKRIFAQHPEKFMTLTQLYFQLFPGRIIAVTGTNGKSTTTKLIAKIVQVHSTNTRHQLKSGRQTAYFTGNDRRNVQILDRFDKWQKSDILAIEVSNRQLKFPLGRAPEIGVVTNVSPNHLDEYIDSFSAYKRGKFSLIANQKSKAISVLNYDNIVTRNFAKKVKSQVLFYSTKSKLSKGLPDEALAKAGVYVENGWIVDKQKNSQSTIKICPVDKIKLIGEHNLSNVLAATAACRSVGVNKKIICEVLGKFHGIPQRLELVLQKNGIRFINDSSSTTPESTIAALRSFPRGSVHLIAGGDPKGVDYGTLVLAIKRQEARVTLLKSSLANILSKSLKKEGVGFKIVENLQEAVRISSQNAANGEVVLLSPSAAWFCYFAGKIPLGGRGFEQFARTFV
ncbi:UDP-N-acetylmuramoyl-L-alanine--D-glutamate ligase [Candidatus Gracilibacteria bacterium]|nr:UDP-N-acetylmuramoyl-L-alanine--D-glutamate ligase [Candidatus Gracilibacteria bacterium]